MLPTFNTLPLETREAMAELCNERLTDTTDVQLDLKVAHWNVSGPNFSGLHELFDEVREVVEDYADRIAERGVQLGGVVDGTAGTVADKSSIGPYPGITMDWQGHVREIALRLASLSGLYREAIDIALLAGDQVTANIFIDSAQGIDKWTWQVGKHVEGEK